MEILVLLVKHLTILFTIIFPIIDSEYSPIGLVFLTLILFVFASGINLKIITSFILKSLFRLFKKKFERYERK